MPKSRNEIEAKSNRKVSKHYSMKLNVNNDGIVIDKLDDVRARNQKDPTCLSIQGYIKKLIEADVRMSQFMRVLVQKEIAGYRLSEVYDNNGMRRVVMKAPSAGTSDLCVVEYPDGRVDVVRDGEIVEKYDA